MTPRWKKHLASVGAVCVLSAIVLATATAAGSLKTGLKVFVIPKNLGQRVLHDLGQRQVGRRARRRSRRSRRTGTETSGTQATAASQLPAIQAAITKGANALIVSATDASALCPTLKQAMAKKITVVTYDSDAPTCRNAVHQPGGLEGDRHERGRPARQADRQDG